MIALKDYQERVLDSLRDFLRDCARGLRPEAAFQSALSRNGSPVAPYLPVQAEGLEPEMPYACLRVPTGGGKTLLACYASGIAKDEIVHADHAVVLWLVPSQTILEQTANALREPRHAYRRALELACGAVEVVTIEEALRLSRAAVDGQTVVIVSTIQAFRVEDTTGRKVYEQNGSFADHLLNVPADRLGDLLPGADGKPKPSLVNMLRLRRPVVIVDEAHNARTELSFSTLGAMLPSCIIEFTATPARKGVPSNVLHRVSAAELKAAQMVKLPLRVVTRHPSQREQLLAEAVGVRADLEKLAAAEGQRTGEYLRPILLIQAERVDGCEPLRDRLLADFGVPRDQIRISVGVLDELKDVDNVSAPSCPVRIIVTVQKLREGWDCPFAYILCSLRETRSATSIEQIVGRILRLPGAVSKQHPDLNCAYAFSVSESLPEVLNELREALESNGFTAAEAERIILPVTQGALPLGAQPRTIRFDPAREIDVGAAQAQAATMQGKVRVDAATGDLMILVPLDESDTSALAACFKSEEAKAKVRAAVADVRDAEKAFGGTGKPRVPSPYQLQIEFAVPRLCVREEGALFEFESTHLLEHPWRLSDKDASLSAEYDPRKRPAVKAGLVDVGARGEVLTSMQEEAGFFVTTVHQQALALAAREDWTVEALITWLDRHIEHRDIPPGESAEFLRLAVRGLMVKYGIDSADVLALDRYRLRDEVELRIAQHRASERKAAFRQYLLPGSTLVVSDEHAVNFRAMSYEPGWVYEGAFQFRKHYFGPKPGELRETTEAGKLTEEFQCAQFIDGLKEVRFWVRNLARRPTSFRLQTASDWFYPDFVCQLVDGRVLVVEYKGEHLLTNAEGKRSVGEVWAGRSGGRCVFVMPSRGDFSSIERVVSVR